MPDIYEGHNIDIKPKFRMPPRTLKKNKKRIEAKNPGISEAKKFKETQKVISNFNKRNDTNIFNKEGELKKRREKIKSKSFLNRANTKKEVKKFKGKKAE